jgi:EAL domain-containing protein (putative c-di-GMP-specific phosphodiesterase class I)
MLSSIMSLSRNLGLKVTAEGIETPEQAAIIQDIDCDYIQGYLTGKPVAVQDLPAFIMTRFAKQIKARVAPPATPQAPSMRLVGAFG